MQDTRPSVFLQPRASGRALEGAEGFRKIHAVGVSDLVLPPVGCTNGGGYSGSPRPADSIWVRVSPWWRNHLATRFPAHVSLLLSNASLDSDA